MRVLVLGGYGLIGLEIVRRLIAGGCDVVGLGRSEELGRRAAPAVRWIGADLARLDSAESWAPFVQGMDAVVNASGALQDGLRDNLDAAQRRSICALIAACERAGVKRFIQISAPGASEAASTAFLRTKGAADQALRASTLDWIIFKPGLVISAHAYGGTSLLRQLAALPLVQPLVLADRRVQLVAADDVAEAVAAALGEGFPPRQEFDLLHPQAITLRALVAKFRLWLGFAPAAAEISVPDRAGFAVARLADAAGWLGWRSPLRTTALRVLSADVLGDGALWTGHPLKSPDNIFAALPATAQEKVFARAQLLFPLLLATLSAFWIASGVIGLLRVEQAATVLAPTWLASAAPALVISGALADIAVGVALCIRPFFRAGLIGAASLSLGYLALSLVYAPALWLDPLGPMVKVFPVLALIGAVWALKADR